MVQTRPVPTLATLPIDPLRSQGEMLAQTLQMAGVPVEQRTYPGVIHEFFGMGAVGQAKQAEDFGAMRLDASFKPSQPAVPRPATRAGRTVR